MCQTTPLTSRILVTRSPTASTVPVVSPTVMTSPTPYWSSSRIEMPARKSPTRFCAPKPSATPSTPALATIGARLIPKSPRIVIPAMPKIRIVDALLRIDPSACDR